MRTMQLMRSALLALATLLAGCGGAIDAPQTAEDAPVIVDAAPDALDAGAPDTYCAFPYGWWGENGPDGALIDAHFINADGSEYVGCYTDAHSPYPQTDR